MTPENCEVLLSSASIPVFEIGLNALSALFDKVEAYAEATRINPENK